jgi:hypothetical protein
MPENTKERDKWLNDIRWVLSTPQGRRFYWGMMAECRAFKEEFISDTNLCYFNKGKKKIGLDMYYDLLEAEPKAYLQMLQENEAQKTREDIKTEKQIKEKQRNPYKIDSPSLPNTEAEMSVGGRNG